MTRVSSRFASHPRALALACADADEDALPSMGRTMTARPIAYVAASNAYTALARERRAVVTASNACRALAVRLAHALSLP